MTLKVITSFTVLMKYARELGEARKSGDKDLIEKAKMKHDEYRDLCLKSDEMSLNCRISDLS